MSHIIQSLELVLTIAKMSIPELLLARKATNNPKFISILDKAIDSKLPKNNKQ